MKGWANDSYGLVYFLFMSKIVNIVMVMSMAEKKKNLIRFILNE